MIVTKSFEIRNEMLYNDFPDSATNGFYWFLMDLLDVH